ncbi:MAG: helix-turn-helix transcriptional regulator, partial [Deltaproteobacteria bacterium]|nr:helix-turn-helix transcriptional regulator [Deltaproteobacteria bacterium]
MTKTKILNAAAELFADKGFNGTKVQEIADAAGVNKAMLYYY